MSVVENSPDQGRGQPVLDLCFAAFSETRVALLGSADAVDLDVLTKALVKQQSLEGVAELIGTLPALPKEKVSEEAIPESTSIRQRLELLVQEAGALEDFITEFTESVFIAGGAKPKGVQPQTYDFLQQVADRVVAIRSATPKDTAPKSTKTAKALRALQGDIVEFTQQEGLKTSDYVALNSQFEAVSRALQNEQRGFIESVPKKLRAKIEDTGLSKLSDLRKVGTVSPAHLKKLFDAGVLEKTKIEGAGDIVAYAHANSTTEQYEALLRPRVREAISEALFNEFKEKYSNKYRPIGTDTTRESGVANLLDSIRLKKIADAAGVAPAHVVLSLGYLEEHGLVKNSGQGYELSEQGKHVGIGMRAIRFVQRAREIGAPTDGAVSIERYLEAAKATRADWRTPTYEMQTSDGGAPWVYLLDELYAGNARIDTEVLQGVINDIKRSDRALVIASNMLQGAPEVEPRAARTSVRPEYSDGIDYRDYGNQIKLVKELLTSLGHPTLQLHGKAELETANGKADVQRVRDMQARRGMERADEERIASALSRMNEISERAGRKYNAPLQAELLDFVANVVMPLEMKLGRELMQSSEVREQAGLHMNELEILRDIATFLIQDAAAGSTEGLRRIQDLYRPFLALEVVGPEYISCIEQVLFPELEVLEAGKPVARGGARIQFKTPEGKDGLRITSLPEARFGISEAMNPTDKIMRLIKSRTLRGEEREADIVTVGATGQPFFSMTAGGIAVVAADTLQASNYDDRYSATEAGDRHKRRRWVRGGESYGGSIAFSGGVHEGIKTDAYTLRLWNPKIQEVLDQNAAAGKESTYVDLYSTSDWQTGSPTAKPATWLRGLLWAIENNQDNILINGDVLQGQNYGRQPAESQLTGIVGVEDQQAFVTELMKPVLEAIRQKVATDPEYKIPKFTILTGNHETNTQANRGGQGIWYLQALSNQIESFYQGAFGSEIAETHVLYPKKFVDRMGIDVDYSHVMFDFTDSVGFRIAAQHYVGSGTKGSSTNPPIQAAAKWAQAMENEMRPVHGFLLGHWHTQSVTQSDGVFHCIFGANADKSGFEWHLGYPTTVPASGRVRLYSDRPPELFFVTDPYLRLQDEKLKAGLPAVASLVDQYGSLEEYIESVRVRISGRDQKSFSYKETENAMKQFLDPHRRIE